MKVNEIKSHCPPTHLVCCNHWNTRCFVFFFALAHHWAHEFQTNGQLERKLCLDSTFILNQTEYPSVWIPVYGIYVMKIVFEIVCFTLFVSLSKLLLMKITIQINNRNRKMLLLCLRAHIHTSHFIIVSRTLSSENTLIIRFLAAQMNGNFHFMATFFFIRWFFFLFSPYNCYEIEMIVFVYAINRCLLLEEREREKKGLNTFIHLATELHISLKIQKQTHEKKRIMYLEYMMLTTTQYGLWSFCCVFQFFCRFFYEIRFCLAFNINYFLFHFLLRQQ